MRMKDISTCLHTGTLALVCGVAWAQGTPTPKPQDLEPGVNTSAITPSAPAPTAEPAAPPAANSQPAAKAATQSSSSTRTGSQGAKAAAARTPAPNSGAGKAHDSIQLDATQITGNRELPKVLYIVPWKRSDLGDLVGKPVNSLLDEVLTPVDRDVFKRENRYYDALKPDSDKAAAGAAPQGKP